MADGSFPGLVSKDRNVNAAGNPIFVQLTDGTDISTIDGSGNLNVSVANVTPGTGASDLGKAEDAVHASGDVGVLALAVRKDADSAFAADGDYVPLQINDVGALKVDVISSVSPAGLTDDGAFTVGTDSVNPQGFLADETTPDSVDEGDIGIARMTLDRKQLNVLVDATTDANRLVINASGEIGVVQATHDDLNANVNLQVNDVDVSTTAPVPVSRTTAENTELNPIFVHNVDTVVSGEEVHDFDTAAAVGSDAVSNHDYTVVGTFLLKSVIVSGSGNVKFEIQSGPVATLVTVAVGFLTGRQGDTKQVNFDPPLEVTGGVTPTVRVIRTNRQGASTDVYSTIIGNDV